MMKKLPKQAKFVTLTIAAAMLFSFPAFAQTITPVADTTTGQPIEQKSPFKIDVGYSHRIKTDIKGGSGSFNVQSTGVKASNHLQLNPCYSLDTAMSYEYNIYQMQNNNRRGFWRSNRFDWNKVHLVTLTSLLRFQQMDEKWSFYGGPIINVGAEEGSSIGRTFSGGGAAGFDYVFSPTLTAGAGLAVVSRIEDPVAVVPLVRLDWMFAEQWKLHAGFTDLGSSAGYGMDVNWNPIEKLTLSSGVQQQYKRFRLANESGRRHERYTPAVASDKFAVAYAKACYDITDKIGVEGYAGMAFSGKLKVENRNGQALAEEKYDQTPMVGLRTSFAF
jgi:hypothetical protein